MWKWILGIFLVLAVMCGAGGYFLGFTEQGKSMLSFMKPGEQKTEVRLEKVERGNLTKVVSAPGSVEPKTKLQVSAQVSTKITALPFREGDAVKKGDVVCRLDAVDYVAALESAQASLKGEGARLAGLKAERDLAEAEWGRTRELFDSKDVSKSDLDTAAASLARARASVQSSEHAIEVAQAGIDRAQKNLDLCTITSSIDGMIVNLNSEVGEQVLGTSFNAGTVIMEIADLSTMLVKAKVDESNIGPVKAGQKSTIIINAYPDKIFPGVVELVGLKRELERDGTGYFETQVLIQQSPDDRLPWGGTANVDIQVQTYDAVLKIPSQSVVDRRVDELAREITDNNPNVDKSKVFARVVYKFIDGKAKASPVTIGSSDVTHTVILNGLTEGDTIVSGPYKVLVTLKDEQRLIDEETAKKEREAKGIKPKPVATAGAGNGKS